MDILSQYKEQHPEAFREKPQWQPPSEYGFFVRLVMRLSGGRIQDARRASYVLLGVAVCIFLTATAIFFAGFDVLPAPRFSEEEARKQLEEYKTIQPF